MNKLTILAACAGLAAPSGRAADWPAFRGPDGNGISTEVNVPRRWGAEENVRWKAPLPGPGNSSPIVSQGRVFVTCATEEGKNRGLYCFDRRDGRLLWSRIVHFQGEEPTHGTNPYCASTPAADGRRIVVWHGSAGAYCYDYEGNELWSRDLGLFRHIWGYASSPVISGSVVYLNCGPGARTFVTALDMETGAPLWQVDEPGGDDDEIEWEGGTTMWTGSWSTPTLVEVGRRMQLVVSLPRHVLGFDPADGSVLWECGGLGYLVYTSALVGEGVCVAMGGYYGPAIGFRIGGDGDITATHRLWLATENNPQRIGSGVIIGGHIFMANEPGTAQCLALETGEERWQERLSGARIWSSLLAAEGCLYATDQEGTTHIFAPDPDRLRVLGRNEVGEPTNSTPAFSDGQVFLRTHAALRCIEEGAAGE